MNPDEAYYRYNLASNLNVYCSGLSSKYHETKMEFLQIAKEEVIKAENNYSLFSDCLALRSLIELELGNEAEGFRIKDEMFKNDTMHFRYRINLAVYYLNHNNDSGAINEINIVLSKDIKNINAFKTKVLYLLRKGDNAEAIKTCYKILTIEPGNRFAMQTLSELNKPK